MLADRATAGLALRSSFASALNELLFVTAGVALVGAVCATAGLRLTAAEHDLTAFLSRSAAQQTPTEPAAIVIRSWGRLRPR